MTREKTVRGLPVFFCRDVSGWLTATSCSARYIMAQETGPVRASVSASNHRKTTRDATALLVRSSPCRGCEAGRKRLEGEAA